MIDTEGWIKFYRKSRNHWLYNESRPNTKREAWEDMLLIANHTDNKVLIHGELIECKTGQSVMSLSSWAKEFKWTVKQVRTFFKLLEKDQMIIVEGLRKTTRITICNYGIYQQKGQTEGTQKTNKGQSNDTEKAINNNEKNLKNDNNKTNNKVISDCSSALKKHEEKGNSEEPKIEFAESVKLTKKEYDKLIEKHGLEDAKEIITILSNYKVSKGKKYKSDYAAIGNWVAEEQANRKLKRLQNQQRLNNAESSVIRKINDRKKAAADFLYGE